MKKLISLLILTAAITTPLGSVFAEDTADTVNNSASVTEENILPEATENPEAITANIVTVSASVEQLPFPKASTAVLELQNSDGNVLATAKAEIAKGTTEVKFTFNVPKYTVGEDFTLKINDGIDCLQYCDKKYYKGHSFTLPTYVYETENGAKETSTDISVTIRPTFDKALSVSYNGKATNAVGARIIDETAMVPVRSVAEAIGLSVNYNEQYKAVSLAVGDKYIFFNVGTTYTTIFGKDTASLYPTTIIDGTAYVPLRTLAEALECTLNVTDHYTYMDIDISESPIMVEYFKNAPVNQWGISSRTNYMVWVSLSEYKVRLYEGKQYQWKQILEAPCAIGAPSTPSITGSYEYQYKSRWDYGTYYVGPCLVFHGGYALHSVLLYQNGTEYDGRVGVQISHGCIRLKKKDIDFIANTIPVGTRIYLTK